MGVMLDDGTAAGCFPNPCCKVALSAVYCRVMPCRLCNNCATSEVVQQVSLIDRALRVR